MEMAHNKISGVAAVAVVVLAAAAAIGGVRAQVVQHHVMGGDRGWETSNIVGDWSARRVFRVGDIIWFAYSTAQDSIVELGSLEEYESCDLTNPIRMYTDGLDKISLDGVGIRYFASGNIENCKKGLKQPVNVQPHVYGPEPFPTPAESPFPMEGEHWSIIAESPLIDGPTPAESQLVSGSEGPTTSFASNFLLQFWENKQTINSFIDGVVGPTSSYALDSHNGLPITDMHGEMKWAKRLSEKSSDGPTSLSAPMNLGGPLFGLWAVGLLLHVINYY